MSKTLREIVKEIQFAKDWTVEDVAKSIGYSRVHLTKEMSKGDNSELKKLLLSKHADTLQNVSRSKSKGNDDNETLIINADLNKHLKDLTKDIVQTKATVNILKVTVAQLAATSAGKAIGTMLVELQKAIDEESDRLFSEMKKKYG
jgi:hypothetical protein